jgi:hypothetical protein
MLDDIEWTRLRNKFCLDLLKRAKNGIGQRFFAQLPPWAAASAPGLVKKASTSSLRLVVLQDT